MKYLLTSLLTLGFFTSSAQSIDAIVNSHVNALGGKEKLSKLKSIRLTGSINMPGYSIPVIVTKEHLTFYKKDLNFKDSRAYTLVTKDSGYILLPALGLEPIKMEPLELRSYSTFLDIQSPLYNYKQKGNKIEYIGIDMVNDTPCITFKCTFKNGLVTKYSLSSKTFLIKRVYTKTVAMGVESDIYYDFDDYREVDGFKIPFTETQIYLMIPSKIEYTDIKINVAIPLSDKKPY